MEGKELLHKILNDELTSEEEKTLLSNPRVAEKMQHEWDKLRSMPYADSVDGDKMQAKIMNVVRGVPYLKRLKYYKAYSIAASVLIAFMLGSVAWLYQEATKQPEEMCVMVCDRQTVDSVTLPDGTLVLISSGSKLSFPQSFKGNERRVRLSGQAFFDVARDKEKPFIVETSQMEVTALGTAFEVFSFDKMTDGETVLLNGKVKISLTENSSKNKPEYVLYPDQKLSVGQDGKVQIEKVDANKYSAWRSKGCLSFENEKLSMIIPRLERWYKKTIICDKQVADTYHFSFTIDDETCEDVLRMMCRTSTLSYQKEENAFVLKKK